MAMGASKQAVSPEGFSPWANPLREIISNTQSGPGGSRECGMARQGNPDKTSGTRSAGEPAQVRREFGRRLRAARLALGYTQEQMAYTLGIQPARYGKYEIGRSEGPSTC